MGAQVILGDRPIEITLKRAWLSLKPEERGALLLALVAVIFRLRPEAERNQDNGMSNQLGVQGMLRAQREGARREELGDLPALGEGEEELLSQSMELFATHFPSLYGKDLAACIGPGGGCRGHDTSFSLAEALIRERDYYLAWTIKRSKAVNGSKRVVAVMGAMHVKGVMEAVMSDNGGKTPQHSPATFTRASLTALTLRLGDKLSFSKVVCLPEPVHVASGSRVRLSSENARLVRETLLRMTKKHGPTFLRDFVVGSAVAKALQMAWNEPAGSMRSAVELFGGDVSVLDDMLRSLTGLFDWHP
jgi:hypothetical protein